MTESNSQPSGRPGISEHIIGTKWETYRTPSGPIRVQVEQRVIRIRLPEVRVTRTEVIVPAIRGPEGDQPTCW